MNDMHSCSYFCDRPACIKAQRDELRAALAAQPAEPVGDVVVSCNEDGQIVAVTRQDDEGRILSVIAEAQPAPSHRAPSHRLSDARMDLDSVEHMQGGANGPTIRLRGFINVQTGPTAPQPPIDNAFVAEGCEQFSPPADIVNPISQQEPVAYRHSKTGQLYDSEEEVPLADGDEWAEPLYAAPVAQQEPSAWRQWSTKQHDWDYQTNRGDLRPDALAEPLFVAAAQPGAIEQALQKIADFGQEQEQKPVAWIGLPGKGTPLFTAPPAPAAVPPFSNAQLDRLYANSPEHHKDATSAAAFKRIVKLAERAHGIAAAGEKP